ncbi:hypothetical protein PC121_g20739 [Phytophthora cactorum]|nr:hypothetical protein PC121_g20739 [Phytophthora cactorum]
MMMVIGAVGPEIAFKVQSHTASICARATVPGLAMKTGCAPSTIWIYMAAGCWRRPTIVPSLSGTGLSAGAERNDQKGPGCQPYQERGQEHGTVPKGLLLSLASNWGSMRPASGR